MFLAIELQSSRVHIFAHAHGLFLSSKLPLYEVRKIALCDRVCCSLVYQQIRTRTTTCLLEISVGRTKEMGQRECSRTTSLPGKVMGPGKVFIAETQRIFHHRDEVFSEILKFAGIPDFKLDLPKVVSCKAERYKGTYAGCYSGNSRVARMPFLTRCPSCGSAVVDWSASLHGPERDFATTRREMNLARCGRGDGGPFRDGVDPTQDARRRRRSGSRDGAAATPRPPGPSGPCTTARRWGRRRGH